jgi:RNA polymerase sigma-70 factor, ECF subfamily
LLDRPVFDAQYVARLRDGDPSAHESFYEYFRPILYVRLRSHVRSAHLIDEAMQETFLRVLTIVKRPNAVEHPERFPAFVHSVCRNVTRELFREEARTSPIPEDAPDPTDPNACPEKQVATLEIRERVEVVLDEMPVRDRRLIRAIFFEDLDKDLICKEFGVEREYLRVLLHRALGRLKGLLKNHHGIGAGQ